MLLLLVVLVVILMMFEFLWVVLGLLTPGKVGGSRRCHGGTGRRRGHLPPKGRCMILLLFVKFAKPVAAWRRRGSYRLLAGTLGTRRILLSRLIMVGIYLRVLLLLGSEPINDLRRESISIGDNRLGHGSSGYAANCRMVVTMLWASAVIIRTIATALASTRGGSCSRCGCGRRMRLIRLLIGLLLLCHWLLLLLPHIRLSIVVVAV
mmetsp:Transcript_27489/g.64434  ORF Transcript_27489/g.64434 Transcript_27489/m.64434 type:complete len:207 (-) Transcript_27489:350-970(-)